MSGKGPIPMAVKSHGRLQPSSQRPVSEWAAILQSTSVEAGC